MRKSLAIQGFTLVELTVVLAVIGTILGGAIVMFSASLEGKAYSNTQAKLEALQEALLKYRIAYNRLPCPANYATYAMTDANFGVESQNVDTNCGGGTPAPDDNDATAASGMVPVRTLGLPDDMALDHWGRRIRYVMAPAFAATNAFDDITTSDTNARLRVINNDNISAELTNKAAYVLVSGGANGHGMRGGPTGTLINAAMTNTNELKNCKCNTNGTINGSADLTAFAQGNPKADNDPLQSFDDQVVFATRIQLRDAGE